jgi:hypothetical protein
MLGRFERLMEQAIEGGLRRAFSAQLEPVQLAKAAARAMEEQRVVGLRGAEVPNAYTLFVAPADFERFGGYTPTLVRELTEYLGDYAHDRGVRPIGPLSVELVPAPNVGRGRLRVQAQFVSPEPAVRQEVATAVGETRQLRLNDLANAQRSSGQIAPELATLWLTAGEAIRYALEPEASLARLGRASDNDLAIPQQRVSRYHAQLRRVEATWLVYDLESTNGTFVDDRRVAPEQPLQLPPACTLRLGDFPIRVSPAAPGPEPDRT